MHQNKSAHPWIEVPIRYCPKCKERPMVVEKVLPAIKHWRDATEIRYRCTKCETAQSETIPNPPPGMTGRAS